MTGRVRHIAYNNEQFKEIAKIEIEDVSFVSLFFYHRITSLNNYGLFTINFQSVLKSFKDFEDIQRKTYLRGGSSQRVCAFASHRIAVSR